MKTTTKKDRKESIKNLSNTSKTIREVMDKVKSGELDLDTAKTIINGAGKQVKSDSIIIDEHQKIQREKLDYYYANLEYKNNYLQLQRDKLNHSKDSLQHDKHKLTVLRDTG